MSSLQILSPLEWFAFVAMPCILVAMAWISVRANAAWLKRERQRDRERETLG